MRCPSSKSRAPPSNVPRKMIEEYFELFLSTCGVQTTFLLIVISASSPHHSGALAERAFRNSRSSVLTFRTAFEVTITQRKPDGETMI